MLIRERRKVGRRIVAHLSEHSEAQAAQMTGPNHTSPPTTENSVSNFRFCLKPSHSFLLHYIPHRTLNKLLKYISNCTRLLYIPPSFLS
jgi:hypothetical protein